MKQLWLTHRLKQEAGTWGLVSKDFHMDGSPMWRSQGIWDSGRRGSWGSVLDEELVTKLAFEYNYLKILSDT